MLYWRSLGERFIHGFGLEERRRDKEQLTLKNWPP